MLFVTTFNEQIYKKFAYKFIDTYLKTKQEIPLVCYVDDDFNYKKNTNITYIKLQDVMPELLEFKKRHKDKLIENDDDNLKPHIFLQNAIKFSHKVFSQCHASYGNKKFMYVDGDCVFNKKVDKEFFNDFIPDNSLLTFYGRPNWVETGIIGFNPSNNETSKKFFNTYLSFYNKDKIFDLKFKTDCQALDKTRSIMKNDLNYVEIDKGDGLDGHVIYRDKKMLLYIDHQKGKRKFDHDTNVKPNNDQSNIIILKLKIFIVKFKNFIFKKINKI